MTAPHGPTLPEVSERDRQVFVAGARWWEFKQTGATMWPSDQQEAYEAAPAKIASHLASRAERGKDGGT